MNEEKQEKKNWSKFWRISIVIVLIILTVCWIWALNILTFRTKGCEAIDHCLQHFSPNELGDFLAGAFAPLAFIWLAGAVFIQSIELANQQDELKRTTDAINEQTVHLAADFKLKLELEANNLFETGLERVKNTLNKSMFIMAPALPGSQIITPTQQVYFNAKEFELLKNLMPISNALENLKKSVAKENVKWSAKQSDVDSWCEARGHLINCSVNHANCSKTILVAWPKMDIDSATRDIAEITEILEKLTPGNRNT